MKTFASFLVVAFTGALALPAAPAFAQSGAPISEPPPSSSDRTLVPAGRASQENAPRLPASAEAAAQATVSGIKGLRFAAVDADSDGRISLEEFVTFMDAGNVARNSNGSRTGVSPTELLFRQIDRNGDNFLSESEVTAYQDEQARK